MNKKLRKILDEIVNGETHSFFGNQCIILKEAVDDLRLYLKIEDERKDLRKAGVKVK